MEAVTQRLEFWVPGRPIPWKRAASNGGQRYTPAPQRAYQRQVAACAREVLLGTEWTKHARYRAEITITPPDRRRFDLDNVAKTALDALNLVVWNDDSQVDMLVVGRLGPDKEAPGMRVVITVLG